MESQTKYIAHEWEIWSSNQQLNTEYLQLYFISVQPYTTSTYLEEFHVNISAQQTNMKF